MDINYYKQYEPIFGVWTITRLIGEGSFGKVFEMEREDFGVTYKAALKAITVPANESEVREVMAEGMDEASARDYFGTFVQDLVKEFALMSKLKGNSNVVSYENHQVISHRDGIGWDILIQMELLTPLNEYTRTHTVTRQDVIKLGIDMCKALELCQKYNIIHRDVKPENIFISDAGDFKLGDFGIARTVEKTTSGLSKKGTYTYMAPEVYKGEAYGSTVDIYSLGIVLYRLLNGNRTPFLPAAPAPITHADRENALVKRLSGAILPPPIYGEGRLSEIVLKACAYEPKERYSSPVQMRHELEAIFYSREEGTYIYPEGDDVPQDSVHYIKTGEEPLKAEYERIQGDAEKSSGGVSGGNAGDSDETVSDFDENRTISSFDENRTVSGLDANQTVSGNPPPEPAARWESRSQIQQKPKPKKGIGKIAAAGAACGALVIGFALVFGGGSEKNEEVSSEDIIYIGVYDMPETGAGSAESPRSMESDLMSRWMLEAYQRENPAAEMGGKEYEIQLVFSSQMEESYGRDEMGLLLEDNYALDAADFFKENGCAAVIMTYIPGNYALNEKLAEYEIPSIGIGCEGSFYMHRGGGDAKGMWQFVKEELGAESVLCIEKSASDESADEEFFRERYAQPLECGLAVESRWYDGGVITPTADVIYTDDDAAVEILEMQNYDGPLIMSDGIRHADSSLDLYYFSTSMDRLKDQEFDAFVRPIMEEHGMAYNTLGVAALDAYRVIVKALSQCGQLSDLTQAIRGTSLDGFEGGFFFDENGQAVYNTISYWHDGEWKNYEF